MIELIPNSRDDILEFHVSGVVTDEDYTKVLIPALEEAIARVDRLRLLARFSADFTDYTLGAMLEDARVGLKHWRGFDRIAVVADATWITALVRAFSIFMPCPVMTFSLSDYEAARRWLTESLGSIHQTDLGGGVLQLQLMGQLDSSVYADATEDLNAFIRANDRFRLLIDLREFDGWQGLAAIGEHLKIVRDHHKLLDKAAIVGDAAWQKLAERAGSTFISGETRYFEAGQFEDAVTWIKSD